MSKATQVEQTVTTGFLKPLSSAEILARDEALGTNSDSLAMLEEWFPNPAPVSPRKRSRSKVSEIDAKAEAHPLTRKEREAKKVAAELRHPELKATQDGSFVVPAPPEKPAPQIPPASWVTWE
jgi:hypothetical protein